MKRLILLVSSLFMFSYVATVLAQEAGQIPVLQGEISELKTQLAEKEAELAEILADQAGFYTIETLNATYTFSNPRIENDILVLDMDYTNDSKGSTIVYDEMWMLTFAQEDEISINQLWVGVDMADLPEVEGRRPLTSNLRIKSGATINLVIGLTKSMDYLYGPYMYEYDMTEDNSEVVPPMIPMTEPFDEESPLFIRVDQYYRPEGQLGEVEIPLK
ncbi:hypothetical protein [Fundicoccus culcitae]|uniref:DUF5067 domain-containing protein n=1 Tax=Fundicoccus culcitae TaxID=2969821 RepID=A0ABY5P4C3_9LACT|nr:hypothetical protein [Fundicoccus culcitae]UUX33596.1 hypothetical protein NRE15_11920 [Fundicoccus culcitae]